MNAARFPSGETTSAAAVPRDAIALRRASSRSSIAPPQRSVSGLQTTRVPRAGSTRTNSRACPQSGCGNQIGLPKSRLAARRRRMPAVRRCREGTVPPSHSRRRSPPAAGPRAVSRVQRAGSRRTGIARGFAFTISLRFSVRRPRAATRCRRGHDRGISPPDPP